MPTSDHKARRGRKPKKPKLLIEELENEIKLLDEVEMHCCEKALALGLIVKEEYTPSEVVEIQQDL